MCQYYLLYNETKTSSDENQTALKIELDDIDILWLNLLKYVDSQDVKVFHK